MTTSRHATSLLAIPAQTGIHGRFPVEDKGTWIFAFKGMMMPRGEVS
jgi:hypothetical protein